MSAISLTGISKSFGSQRVVDSLDLEVEIGAVVVVLGASGSGKTTLLRMIAGFDRPDAGTISLDGRIVDGPSRYVPPEKRRIGYVSQEGNLFPHLTVARNIAFGMERRARNREAIGRLLDLVGLTDLGKRYPHQLSGGQQQRVALARALAIDPQVVLLDEPFSSLDAGLRSSLRVDVMRILRESGATVVFVTHDQSEALSVADRVGIIMGGGIRQFTTPEELYNHPVDAETAGFLGEANLVSGIAVDHHVDTPLGRFPLAPESRLAAGPVTVLVRPEQIVMSSDRDKTIATPGIPARVVQREYYGHDCVVIAVIDGDIAIRIRCSGRPQVEVGDPVRLSAGGEVVAWRAGIA